MKTIILLLLFLINSLLASAQNESVQSEEIESLYQSALSLSKEKDFNNSIATLKSLSNKYDPDIKKSKNYEINKLIAKNFYNLRNTDSVIYYTQKSKIYHSDSIQLGYIYSKLSEIYTIKKEYNTSSNYLDSLLILSTFLNDDELKSEAHYRLGKLQRKTRFYDSSLENLEAALALKLETNEITTALGANYRELGRLYFETRDYKNALDNYSKAFTIYENLSRDRTLARLHDDLASVYIKTKDYKSAKGHVEKAIELKHKLGNTSDLPQSHSRLGRLLYLSEQKDLPRSLIYLDSAKLAYSTKGKIEQLRYVETYLFNAHQLKGDRDEATRRFNAVLKLTDSLKIIENKQLIAEAEIKYESLRQERDLIEKNNSLLETELENSHLTNAVFISLFILSVLTLIILHYWNQKKQLTKAIEIAVSKKRKLEMEVFSLTDQVEKQELLINHRANKKEKNKDDFLEYLGLKYELESLEIQLWNLIADGHSQKEIANALHRSESTIKTRKRLKLYPKLNIAKEENSSRKQQIATVLYSNELQNFQINEI